MTVEILVGDVRERLRELPDESVHCVVTSPPYWGLRDYGTARWEGGDPACEHRSDTMREGRNEDRTVLAGSPATNMAQLIRFAHAVCGKCGAQRVDNQLGLEPTPQEHVARMVEIFREVRRVLRRDGVCWVNYGDSYATSPNGRSAADTKATGNDDRTFRDKPFGTATPGWKKRITAQQARDDVDVGGWGARDDSLRWRGGDLLKAKDLCMVPFRFALAMQADGWWLRSVLPWVKRNAMPESIRDRPATAVEYVFMFTRSERYAYDAEAVRQARVTADDGKMPDGRNFRNTDLFFDSLTKPHGLIVDADGEPLALDVAPKPFREAHFATFPLKLIEPLIKAGCPAGGTVLDPFGGSGTTGLVADQLGRHAILIELNPSYANIARRRVGIETAADLIG